jgi:hypothetical protein
VLGVTAVFFYVPQGSVGALAMADAIENQVTFLKDRRLNDMNFSKTMLAAVFGLVVFLMAATFALADDLNPPPWRGLPGTTFQKWEFSVDDRTPDPDSVNNPYGNPQMTVTPTRWPPLPDPGFEWADTFQGRQGVYSLSGEIDTTIPNQGELNPEKHIRLQMTWFFQEEFNWVDKPEYRPYVVSPLGGGQTYFTLTEEDLLENGWHHTTFDAVISPNPPFETITLSGAYYVDELVIDTLCPEPSTIVLAVMGLIGLAIMHPWRKVSRN